jgi:hypothetical protein
MKIEGLPEGYDIVRIGRPKKGELFIGASGLVAKSTGGEDAVCYLILRKVERYRPFANAEEFKPHRDKWWKWKEDFDGVFYPPEPYNHLGHDTETWDESFEDKVFEDGTPFGVEVSDED